VEKTDRSYVRYVRYAVQWSLVFLLVYAGYHFYLFVNFYAAGGTGAPPVERPPSVEGFLPIGALMALKLWLTTGIFDHVHPAGLVVFISALVLSAGMKKTFCGFICPVGALSDITWKIGRKVFGRSFSMPARIDYPLRALKYMLMTFFLYVVVVRMPAAGIAQFLTSDYYRIADVKMLYFFTEPTTEAALTLLMLFLFSLFFKNFWCRYLCPYGALLGLVSVCSPVKISRDEAACVNCGKCARNCPSLLPVDRRTIIRSPECTGCLTCISHCPANGALEAAITGKRKLSPLVFVVIVSLLFFGVIGGGILAGRWSSSVTPADYARIIPRASFLEHP
jgi:polyferredoxin